MSVNDNLEFTERIKKIKDDCALEFRGSNVHLFVHLLVRYFKLITYFKLTLNRGRQGTILMEMGPL